MIQKITNGIATGAAVSPLWLPSLAQISQGAALLLPVLGCTYLSLQIVAWFMNRNKSDD